MNLKWVKTSFLIVHKLQTNSIASLYNLLTTLREAFQAEMTTIDLLEDQDNSFQLREAGQTAVLIAIRDLNTTFSKYIYNLDTAFFLI